MANLDFPVSEILAQLDSLDCVKYDVDDYHDRHIVENIKKMILEQKGNVVTVPPDHCLLRGMYGNVYLMWCGSIRLGPQEVIKEKPCHLVIDRGSFSRVLVTPEECQRIEKIIKAWEKSREEDA